MKLASFLQLAALGSAIVLPDEKVLQDFETRPRQLGFDHSPSRPAFWGKLQDIYNRRSSDAKDVLERCSHQAKDAFNNATSFGKHLGQAVHQDYFDPEGWLESASEATGDPSLDDVFGSNARPPHHGRPGHGHKPNMTVYQLIAESKYTTKLAKLINDYPDLVEALNGTEANYTVFAPTDYAFGKIPEHAPKPSEEQLKKLLMYHVSSEFYPAGRVLVTKTIPTLLESESLGTDRKQRLSTNIGFRGLTVNFYSRIVAVNIFGSNGVIHGVDSILIPPPKALKIVDLLPNAFSTLELGLGKTGLLDTLNETDFKGSTWFLPDNSAFSRLGPRINAFLFSSYGLKYLKPLLEYHVIPDRTLYSDAYYEPSSDSTELVGHSEGARRRGPPKGYFHIDLPTLLEDRSLDINIARYGRLIDIKINGFSSVKITDGIAKDGVVHVVSNVLIPPKKLSSGEFEEWNGEDELTEDNLMERLEPFVEYED